MRKTRAILLAVLLAGAVAGSASADTVLYTQVKSNLRAGPSTKNKIVKVLNPGEPVRLGQLKGKWHEVLDTEGKVFAYIYADLVGSKVKTSGQVVGSWKSDIPGLGKGKFEQYMIIKKGDKYYMLMDYFDGSRKKSDLYVKNADGEVRYYKKDDAYVEYYRIHRNSELGLYDKLGQIRAIAPKVEAKKP